MSINWDRMKDLDTERDACASVLAYLFACDVREGNRKASAAVADLIRNYHHADVLVKLELFGEAEVIEDARRGW